MRLILALIVMALLPVSAAENTSNETSKVLLLGVFHFNNPKHDMVKFDTIDVMKPESQAYLNALASKLAAFKPTQILLEYDISEQGTIDQRYKDYLAGKYTLDRNEIYQIGFRVAKLSGLSSVATFDERNTPQHGDLWNYLPDHAPKTMQKIESLVEKLSKQFEHDHKTMSLKQLLLQHNSADFDRENKSFYMITNVIGANDQTFHGADASASWWQRNFRMYANIQLQAEQHKRILVVAGQGHTAILRDFVAIDQNIKEESVLPYLQ